MRSFIIPLFLAVTGCGGCIGVAVGQLPDDRHWFYDYGAPGSEPFAFQVAGHHLYMGGLFLRVDNDPQKKNLTRFNLLTEAWERVPGIDENFNGGVWALENGDDGYLYVGGNFSSVGGVAASGVARFHLASQQWSALTDTAPTLTTPNQGNGPTNGRVLALLKTGTYVYVGGEFTGPAGSPQNERYIRRFQLGTNKWERVGNGLNGDVRCLVAGGAAGQVTAGGGFTGALSQWNGSGWSVLAGGLAGGAGNSPIVRALVRLPDGTLFLGGDFDQVNAANTPIAVRDVASLHGSTWNPLGGGFDHQFIQANGTTFSSDGVYALAAGRDGVYAGGDFDATVGRAVTGLRHVARWDGPNGWRPLGSGLGVTGSQIVNCLAIGPQGDLYAAGVFNTGYGTLGAAPKNFARWHPGRDFTGYVPGAADNTTVRLAPGTAGTSFVISFDTRAGTTYQLRSSSGLQGWNPVNGGQLVGNGQRMQFNLSGFTTPAHSFRLVAIDW